MAEVMKNESKGSGFGFWKTLGVLILVIVVTVVVTIWGVQAYMFPKAFTPTQLSEQEQNILTAKLDIFSKSSASQSTESYDSTGKLQPMPYSEKGAKREVMFTEREVNALIAHNTDLASKFAVDLSHDMASVRLRLPLDADFPMFGGKTLKASAGVEFRYKDEKPVVVLKGVSVWGVPLPNAWLGDLKNVDLVNEFGAEEGFWKSFAAGVENILVENERVVVNLKE